MTYRAEVDGLRCLAVVPVIAFHAGLSVFSGGYVGVDVFFVISGYLITGILADEMARGDVSLIRFYERRARRLLPALFLVMAACLPFAWAWMTPDEMRDFARSLVAVSLFSSNVFFFLQSGYFAPQAEAFPLLHTWSLAVEEQFYIVFPLLLLALWGLGRRPVMAVLLGLAGISLALSHGLVTSQPSASFYLLHTRAWELLAGALVALWQRRDGTRIQGRSEIGAALGLAAIVWSILAFDRTTPFPSLWTLLPVGGTALILLCAAPGTWVARLLSLRGMVWIGLISYSAYLIHQPLFAFARIRSIGAPDPLLMVGLAALTFPLAWLSWRHVEQPFRKAPAPRPDTQPGSWPGGGVGRRAVFALSGAGLAAFVGLGLLGHLTDGLPGRMPPEVLRIAAAAGEDGAQTRRARICQTSALPDPAHPVCATPGPARVALFGDSHAGALSRGLHDALAEAGFGVYQSSAVACWPLTGFRRSADAAGQCSARNAAFWALAETQDFDAIILSARWTLGIAGTRFDNGEGGHEPPADNPVLDLLDRPGAVRAAEDATRRAEVLEAMRARLLRRLEDHRIVLVYPIPEAGWDVPLAAARTLLFDEPRDLSTSHARYRSRNAAVIELFDGITHSNLYRVRPEEVFCDTRASGRCITMLEGKPLYSDDDHLSILGARLLSEKVLHVLDRVPMDLAAHSAYPEDRAN